MGIFNTKVVYQKCMLFIHIGSNYSIKKKNYCQLCIDYESNKYILKFFFFLKKVAFESLLYLTPFQAKVNVSTP